MAAGHDISPPPEGVERPDVEPAQPRRDPAILNLLRRWWKREAIGKVDYERVVARVDVDAGWSPRFAFMTVLSAGIAVLGLLLSSPAVIIGAMLISPLMGPIIGLGFALAIFEWREVRRSAIALAGGSLLAVIFTAAVVLISPLQEVTPEILARTRPNLFDLLVAIFSALAGAYAMIRGRGETIVGVAIATALMPPLAVVGFGLATLNLPVFTGALALFLTNLIAIALTAAIMARIYGFGSALSPKQTQAQGSLIIIMFLPLSIPLAFSLRQIAWETVATRQIRSEIREGFGPDARIAQLETDFASAKVGARAVVVTDVFRPELAGQLSAAIETRIGRPVQFQLSQLVVNQDLSRFERQQAVIERLTLGDAEGAGIAAELSLSLGIEPGSLVVDDKALRLVASVLMQPGMSLDGLRAVEMRAIEAHPAWSIEIVPPFVPLPQIEFGPASATPDASAEVQIETARWALRRWNMQSAEVIGRVALASDGAPNERAGLAEARADAVATRLRGTGLTAEIRTDLPGPRQRRDEREMGSAAFRSVEIVPRPTVAPLPPEEAGGAPAKTPAARESADDRS
jgi:uncharacterized hydrophobic protein (TIGR00271 family)